MHYAPLAASQMIASGFADPPGVDAEEARALQRALAAANAGTFALDVRTLNLALSPEGCRMYGLPADHCGVVSHEEWLELVDDSTGKDVVTRLKAWNGYTQPRTLELRLRDPKRPVWLRSAGRMICGPDGEPMSVIGLLLDVTEEKEIELALREAERRFQVAEEAAAIGCYSTTPDGTSYCSAGFYRMAGMPVETPYLKFDAFAGLVHPDDRERFARGVEEALAGGGSYDAEFRIVRADTGEPRWIHSRAKFLRDESGNVVRSIGANVDITDRKRAEESLRRREAFNRSVIEASADAMSFLDFDGRLLFMNRSAMIGAEIDDFTPLIGTPWTELWPGSVRPAIERELERARGGNVGHFTALNSTPRGTARWWDVVVTTTPPVEEDRGSILVIGRDVTEHRDNLERIAWIANHDALTGLLNRRAIRKRLIRAIDQARIRNSQIGLLLIDLDHFKEVNDLFGHDAGDALLREVSARLRLALGEDAAIARLGGDEFAVFLPDLAGPDVLNELGEAILARLREPFSHGGRTFLAGASLGGAIYPLHGTRIDTLMKNADLAVYAAKAGSRNVCRIFDRQMRVAMRTLASQLRLARSAVAEGWIMPFYQPKVRLSDGAVVGLEALLRIRDESGKLRAPAEIAAAFDDPELAPALGMRMRTMMLADVRTWLDAGVPFGCLSFNVSAAEIRNPDYAATLLDALTKTGIPTTALEVEVTETVIFDQTTGQVERNLRLLDKAGVRIALDDFGTGYASLSHLKRLPVSTLKIDRSFVQCILEHHDDAVIVRALVGLGESLGVDVIAEGVETVEQTEFLKAEGCTFGQGYLFGRPMPAEEITRTLLA
jgi:diguanylate cyclase (GGDEF)-like protein/PAS domain S-box-containing protein